MAGAAFVDRGIDRSFNTLAPSRALAVNTADQLALAPDLDRLSVALSLQELLGTGQRIGVRSSVDRLDRVEAVRSVHKEAAIFDQRDIPEERTQVIGQTAGTASCAPQKYSSQMEDAEMEEPLLWRDDAAMNFSYVL